MFANSIQHSSKPDFSVSSEPRNSHFLQCVPTAELEGYFWFWRYISESFADRSARLPAIWNSDASFPAIMSSTRPVRSISLRIPCPLKSELGCFARMTSLNLPDYPFLHPQTSKVSSFPFLRFIDHCSSAHLQSKVEAFSEFPEWVLHIASIPRMV